MTYALSCIIPAYNEAPRIAAVLAVVLDHPLIGEVLVVDDGSSDGTAEVAEAAGQGHAKLRVLRQSQNGALRTQLTIRSGSGA